MKNIFTSLLIVSSMQFLVGCSNKTPEKKEKQSVSVYNIMGIENTQTDSAQITHHQSPQPYPMEHGIVSEDIEVVAYGSTISRTSAYRNQRMKDDIEQNAKSFLGRKYVWGATGPHTFDCSGFTQWIYRDVGINIPRVSRDQARVGQYLNFHQLKRGDMVFFDTKKRKNGVVSHVGIYLGDGNFIHASSSAKKIVIYNFNKKPFYKKRFMWGRRVVFDNTHLASN